MNIMLLSVSVWSGRAGDMDPESGDAVLLAVGADCAAHRGLCRSALLCLGALRLEGAAAQHGCADLARHHSRHGHEPLPDGGGQRAGLFRCGGLAPVLPADRPLPRRTPSRPRPRRGAEPAQPAKRNRLADRGGRQLAAGSGACARAWRQGAHWGRRAGAGRCFGSVWVWRHRPEPDHRRDDPCCRGSRSADLCRHAQSRQCAHRRGDRRRQRHSSCRDRAADGCGRARQGALPPPRRSSRADLCTGGAWAWVSRPSSAG